MIEHAGPISGVDAGPLPYVATAGYDNQVILWDALTRRAVARACHDHLANQCRFTGDGKALVTSGSDYTARLFSVPGLRLLALFGDHEDDVEMAAPDPTGGRVATASRDHQVRVFDRAGQLLWRLQGHEADVISVMWTADGSQLVSSSDDGTVRRWCGRSGTMLDVLDLGGVETDTAAVDRDGTIFAGTDEGRIVALRDGREQAVDAHASGIKRLVLDAERRLLISSSYDGTARIWSLAGGGARPELEQSLMLPPVVWARSVAVDWRGRLVFGTFGSSYAVYDREAQRWDLDGIHDTGGLNAVCFAGGALYAVGDAGIVLRGGRVHSRIGSLCNFLVSVGDRLFTGGHLGILFDAHTGAPVDRHRSPLNCAVAIRTGGGPAILAGSYTGDAIVLRLAPDGSLRREVVVRLHEQAIKGIACNGTEVFSVDAAGGAAIHSVPDLSLVARLPHAHHRIANGVCALPDGRFATVSRDRLLRLWRGAEASAEATPHTHSIKCVCSSSGGRFVATGSYDGTLALYELASGRWIVHRPTTAGISSLSRSGAPDGFLASSYDGCVYAVDEHGAHRVRERAYPALVSTDHNA